jgi:hypothetical protein
MYWPLLYPHGPAFVNEKNLDARVILFIYSCHRPAGLCLPQREQKMQKGTPI